MVFLRDHGVMHWLWPAGRLPMPKCSQDLENLEDATCKQPDSHRDSVAKVRSTCGEEELDLFEMADSMEKGDSRELCAEFVQPLRRASSLWKFQVERSEDKLSYRLLCDSGEFLLFAMVSLENRCVRFFQYDLGDSRCSDSTLRDLEKPAYTMTFNSQKKRWVLMQEQCDNCRFSPSHRSCACWGKKQQLAVIRHSDALVGDGVNHCMDCCIPGTASDGSRTIWCPMRTQEDLDAPPRRRGDSELQVQDLCSRLPVWNEDIGSLVLDFRGRQVTPSAKNFQLSMPERPDHVVCQFGKLGRDTFGLDFRYPLSVIQAFGIALTTMFWL